MVLQHIRAREPFSTAGANSLDLPPMHLVHVASEVLLLERFRASGPGALYFILAALLNGKTWLLVVSG